MIPFIRRFEIEELFGIYNVDIPFENNVNIFVGENGLGKTTILNCLNYVLQCDSDNLYNIDFKRIIVTFGSGKKISIDHNDIITDRMLDLDVRRRHYMYYEEENKFRNNSIVSIIRKVYRDIYTKNNKKDVSKLDELELHMVIMKTLKQRYDLDVSRMQIEKTLQEFKCKNDWEYIIQDELKENIIYLPTYRRIEEDFNKCMNNDYRIRNDIVKKISNLQFGMDDVEKLINDTCQELRLTTSESFKEMTSNLFEDYADILSRKKKMFKRDIIDGEKLIIVLQRLSEKINNRAQGKIMDILMNKNDIDEIEYAYVSSMIRNLLEIYEKTKEIDDSLDNFTTVCNKYLESKTFIYDPFRIQCELIQEFGGETIEFKNLSSGEKQIISLFSKIYLSKNKNNIILFDEPELSLSIYWQERLIPDIINSDKCKFLIAITHSPFIFDNEYKELAKDIKRYITPIKEKIKFYV